VIEREPTPARSAVGTLPPVAREEHAPRDSTSDASGYANVRHESNHVRPSELSARGADRTLVALEDLGFALPDEHVRTAERADVQGLVARVEDEDALHRARSVAPDSASLVASVFSRECMIRATNA